MLALGLTKAAWIMFTLTRQAGEGQRLSFKVYNTVWWDGFVEIVVHGCAGDNLASNLKNVRVI